MRQLMDLHTAAYPGLAQHPRHQPHKKPQIPCTFCPLRHYLFPEEDFSLDYDVDSTVIFLTVAASTDLSRKQYDPLKTRSVLIHVLKPLS